MVGHVVEYLAMILKIPRSNPIGCSAISFSSFFSTFVNKWNFDVSELSPFF